MSLWLIGAGSMAQAYAKVLLALERPFDVIGRSEPSALFFERQFGRPVRRGGLELALQTEEAPEAAIVGVGIDQLAPTAEALIKAGTKRLLLEKPAGLNLAEVEAIDRCARLHGTDVLIAYNRRFYHSVEQARRLISVDGGLLSMHFEFTEWSHLIAPQELAPGVKEHWLLGNSSHVIDLAYHLGGKPLDWKHWHRGALNWHPSASRFCGAGITESGVLFSYISDWEAPGRWGVELMTRKRRFILRPMELLQVINLGDVKLDLIESENQLDMIFKPGLFRQTQAFIAGDRTLFCDLTEHLDNVENYSRMAGYI